MISLPEYILPYLVIITLVVAFWLIYRNILQPVKVLFITALIYVFFNIISINELISGFSNPSIVTIIILLSLATGLYNRYSLESFIEKILITTKGYRWYVASMTLITSFFSAFINNTAMVALLTPFTYEWGKKNDIAPSKLLIPLSYAAILGGMITIIGTSTTLVLNGFIETYEGKSINQYYLLIIGLSTTVVCLLFIILFSRKLLPQREDIFQSFQTNKREYVVEARVMGNAEIIDKTVSEAGLRHLKGLFLAEIIRGNETIKPVKPNTVIREGDTLLFAGATKEILKITDSFKGVSLTKKPQWVSEKDSIAEVVISSNSSQIGKKIRNSEFRERYDSVVIGVFRNGQRVEGKIGDVIINSGDALLLLCGKSFKEKADLYSDMIIISETNRKSVKPSNNKPDKILLPLFIIIFVLIIFGVLNILGGLLLLFGYFIATNLITLKTIKRNLDINLIGILVLSLAIGKAMVNSGAAEIVSDQIIKLASAYGIFGAYVGIILLTVLLTTFITNVAAVSISFPVAYELAQILPLNSDLLYIAVAFSASAAFLSPLSYQTNLMIYGPGNYRFKDFMIVGLPVTFIYLSIMTVYLIYLS